MSGLISQNHSSVAPQQTIEQQKQSLLQQLAQLEQMQRNSPVTEDRVIQLIEDRLARASSIANHSIVQQIGACMTEDQQKIISVNLHKLPQFFSTDDGKAVIQMIVDALQQ